MKIIINGAMGRMGKEVLRLLCEHYRGAELAAAVDPFGEPNEEAKTYRALGDFQGDADCIVDFSSHAATGVLCEYAKARKLPLVIATTGQTEEELAMIHEAARQIPVFFSANMSLGIALLAELAKTAAKMLPDADIEIIEKHHNRKLDAPSGTALLLAGEIKGVREEAEYVFGRSGQHKREPEEIGIHAVRLGNIVGEHEVILATDTQVITLKHEAQSRSLFAEGAIAAAAFLCGVPNGIYNMKDMINR